MGTIKRGILGGFSGKVGTVIGGNWKGIDYMRSRAANVRNAKTPAQMLQRAKYKAMLEFLQPLLPVIKIGFAKTAVNQTAFNAAMSYNLKNAITVNGTDVTIDYKNVMLAKGSLFPVIDAFADMQNDDIIVSWECNSQENPDELVSVVLYNKTKKVVAIPSGDIPRGECEISFTPPTSWKGDTVEAYAFAKSPDDETVVSNSVYAGSVTIPAVE